MSLSAAQVASFVSEAKDKGSVWAIRDDGGYPAPKNAEGERAMPFWSSRGRVEKIMQAVPAYRPFQLEEIELDRWLAWLVHLESDGLKIGLNWYGKRATGWHLTVAEVHARFDYVRPRSQPNSEHKENGSGNRSIFAKLAEWFASKLPTR